MPDYTVKDIIAVVVTYNAVLNESQSLLSLDRCAVDLDVLIYDNSPSETAFEPFPHLNVIYFHDPSNPGVSTAYNYAAGIAGKHRKRFLLLLDQDTKLPETALTAYVDTLNRYPEIYLFAPKLMFAGKIFSPSRYVFKRGSHFTQLDPGVHSLRQTSFLNSGLLIDLGLFEKVGGYDIRIKLYFSDFEFIDRVRKHINNFVLIDLTGDHELSSTEYSDKKKAITRFNFFCRDGRSAAKDSLSWWQYFITIGLRACKLTVSFRDTKFMHIFFARYVLRSAKDVL